MAYAVYIQTGLTYYNINNITEDEVIAIANAFHQNEEAIFVKGKKYSTSNIFEIQVFYKENGSFFEIEDVPVYKQDVDSGLVKSSIAGKYHLTPKAYRKISEEITSKFIRPKQANKVVKEMRMVTNNKDVFIVHGHEPLMLSQTEAFLRKLDLNPIVLSDQTNEGKTVIEKFEKHSKVSFAIVLLSPDDICGDERRARQNVILELGYFYGKLGRKNVAPILKHGTEKPSDFLGIVYISYEGHWQFELAKEMKAAGLPIDMNKL